MIRLKIRTLFTAALLFGAALAVFHPAPASAQMFGFSDIMNWTGTGSNEAAVVIDWNDGKTPESIAWGYRWNGVATGLQMLQAVDLADPRLVVFTVNDPSFGAIVYGMGYDLNNNGGTFTPGTPGDATTEDGSASDPGDHYAEGFDTKYWAYYNSDNGSPYGGGGAWAYGNDGASTRVLVNGSWDGWSISDASFDAPVPDFPTAAAASVPEPSTGWVLGLGGVVLLIAARRGVGTPART